MLVTPIEQLSFDRGGGGVRKLAKDLQRINTQKPKRAASLRSEQDEAFVDGPKLYCRPDARERTLQGLAP